MTRPTDRRPATGTAAGPGLDPSPSLTGPHTTTRPTAERPLHHDEAEEATLGACLLDPSTAIPQAREILSPEHFYRDANARVFAAICALHDARTTPDPLTLADELTRRGELADVGGTTWIAFLIDATPTAANVVHHARIVREFAAARQIVGATMEIVAALRERSVTAAEAAQQISAALLPVAVDSNAGGFVDLGSALWETLEAIEARQQGTGHQLIPCGFPEIDVAIGGGFEVGEVIFASGAPGSCKTGFGLNLAANMALNYGHGSAVVSAEMKRKANVQRILSGVSGVPALELRKAVGLTRHHWDDIASASKVMATAPLWIDDTSRPAMRAIEAKCRQLKGRHPHLRFIMVDFIQLLDRELKRSGRSEENRALELSGISYDLKGLAKELDCIVLATSQIDASTVEKRPDKRPQPGDLRWSQAMREAGDFMIMLYRPKYYDPLLPGADVLELDFAKAREAPPFKAKLEWRPETQRVVSLPPPPAYRAA